MLEKKYPKATIKEVAPVMHRLRAVKSNLEINKKATIKNFLHLSKNYSKNSGKLFNIEDLASGFLNWHL